MRLSALSICLLTLVGECRADVCLPPPVCLPVLWYRVVPVRIVPLSAPVPSAKPTPVVEPILESPRKEPPKPPLIPSEKETPEAKLPQEGPSFSVYVVQRSEGAKKEEGYRVKFFNHGERDLTLEIDGQEVKLPRGEFVKLKLAREFVWKEKEGAINRQAIPPESPGLDIVIRR